MLDTLNTKSFKVILPKHIANNFFKPLRWEVFDPYKDIKTYIKWVSDMVVNLLKEEYKQWASSVA